ncbi:MAG: signal peptidase I, partial [Myxococcaceae bacterium]
VWGAALIVLVGLGSIVDAMVARPVQRSSSGLRTAGMVALFVLIMFGARWVGRRFWVEPFRVPSAGMAPTLLTGDHFVVDRRNVTISRGDIIVFRSPEDLTKDFVQRVVATGGDLVALSDGQLLVNGRSVSGDAEPCDQARVEDADENCVTRREDFGSGRAYSVAFGHGDSSLPSFPGARIGCPERMQWLEEGCLVPEGSVFTMGDYRDNSFDGRFFGPVPLENVKGRARQVHFSLDGTGIRWERVGLRVD